MIILLRNHCLALERKSTNQSQVEKEKKNGRLIPVQVTAKSRREYKHRGRVVGTAGRRVEDQRERTQMVVSETDENVYHSLPKQKKSKRKQVHSLKEAVEANRPGAKKH